jgi:HEAT repeat protein
MDRRKYFLLFILCLLFCSPLLAQEEDNKSDYINTWRDTLNYGIDAEVLEVIRKIRSIKETALNAELMKLFAYSISTDVRIGILDFFREIKYREAADMAGAVLKNYENEEAALIRSVLGYLSEVGSHGVTKTILELVDNDDDSISMSAIAALGKTGDESAAEVLLTKLDNVEFPTSRKSQLILALGDLGFRKAVTKLMDIAGNKEADKIWRMYACESLGKIKDASAVPVIKKIFSENDPLLKAYAANALANFNITDVIDILIEGLKDNYWKVRVASIKGLARPEGAKAITILKYKARKDPEGVVRKEAIKTLGAIGTGEAFDALRELFENDGEPGEIREAAFNTLIENDLSQATISSIKRTIAKSSEKNPRMLEIIARKLSVTSWGDLKSIYLIFLESSSFVLRIHGIKGAVKNNLYDLKGKIKDLSEHDPNPSVKKEALSALDQM